MQTARLEDVEQNDAPASETPDVALVSKTTADEAFIDAMQRSTTRPNGAVRVRCELRLFNPDTRNYAFWPEANWSLDLAPDVVHSRELRMLVNQLFERVTVEGIAKVRERLR